MFATPVNKKLLLARKESSKSTSGPPAGLLAVHRVAAFLNGRSAGSPTSFQWTDTTISSRWTSSARSNAIRKMVAMPNSLPLREKMFAVFQ